MTERSREMLLKELDKMALGLTPLEKERFLLTHEIYIGLGPDAARAAEELINSENIDPAAEDFDAEAFTIRIREKIAG